jgi:hypothetical protein
MTEDETAGVLLATLTWLRAAHGSLVSMGCPGVITRAALVAGPPCVWRCTSWIGSCRVAQC